MGFLSDYNQKNGILTPQSSNSVGYLQQYNSQVKTTPQNKTTTFNYASKTGIAKPIKSLVKTQKPSVQEVGKSLLDQISTIVSNRLNSVIRGGTQAGVERVKKLFTQEPEELTPITSKGVVGQTTRKYVEDTVESAVNTIKGAGKMTTPYLIYRAATGKPVTPKEFLKNAGETGISGLETAWRLNPAAPIVGIASQSVKNLRQTAQGKKTFNSWDEIITSAAQGAAEQPGVGETLTDNAKLAQAIDVAFMATMVVAPFAKKKIGNMNFKANELNNLKVTLGVKPSASMEEVSNAFKKKMKTIPDAFTANPSPESLAMREELTTAYNTLKKAGVVDQKWAQAWGVLQEKFGFKPKGKEVVLPTKLIAEKTGKTTEKPVDLRPEVKISSMKKKNYPELSENYRKRVEAIADLKAYINDNTHLGKGVSIHEATELPIYDKTPKAGWKDKYPPGHSEALKAEFDYYKSVAPELNKYPEKVIDKAVLGRLHEKYGKYKYGNEMTNPIEFKPKNEMEKEVYNIIINKLDKPLLDEVRPRVEVKPKEIGVPRSQLPTGTGEEKVSQLEARVKQTLDNLSQEQIDKLGLSTYKQMNNKETIKVASEYVTQKPNEAMKVLTGEIEPPKGIPANSIYVAMVKNSKGNLELATKLATLKSTRFGQEIEILKEIDKNSPVKVMGDVVKIREAEFKKRTGKSVTEATKTVKKELAEKVKVDKYDWNSFIDSIQTC
jgi:hypothetical protein